jgi:HlyD family secretion protein
MNATTIQNVVTYNTVIEFDNPDVRLFPGMTAYVAIPVAWAYNVVKIPNGALRFKPDLSDSERSLLYAKYGIKESGRATAAGRLSADGDTPAGGRGQGGQRQAGDPGQGGGGRRNQGVGAGGGGNQDGGNGGRRSGPTSQREDAGIVWKLLPNKTLEPVQVQLGVTDFTFTEQVSGSLKPGDELVIGQSTSKTTTAQQQQPRSPVGGLAGVRRF